MEKKVYVLTNVTPNENGKINYIGGSLAAFENLGKEMLPKVLEVLTVICSEGFVEEYENTFKLFKERDSDVITEALEGKVEKFKIGNSDMSFRSMVVKSDDQDDNFSFENKKFLYQRIKENYKTGEMEEVGIFTSSGDGFYEIIPLVKIDRPLGLSLKRYLPFTVKDGKAYMYDFEGKPCGGPFEYVEPHSGLLFFVAESKDKKYFVDFMGNRLTGENIFFNSADDYNGYIIFGKNDKWGFIHVDSHTVSPVEYDDIEPVELAEAIKVKKGEEWGYLAEDFTFIPESIIEEEDSNWDDVYWYGDEP